MIQHTCADGSIYRAPTREKVLAMIERDLFWQEHVAANTRDPKQRARCLAAASRLQAEIAAMEAQNMGGTE